jgi:hypothetical protein
VVQFAEFEDGTRNRARRLFGLLSRRWPWLGMTVMVVEAGLDCTAVEYLSGRGGVVTAHVQSVQEDPPAVLIIEDEVAVARLEVGAGSVPCLVLTPPPAAGLPQALDWEFEAAFAAGRAHAGLWLVTADGRRLDPSSIRLGARFEGWVRGVHGALMLVQAPDQAVIDRLLEDPEVLDEWRLRDTPLWWEAVLAPQRWTGRLVTAARGARARPALEVALQACFGTYHDEAWNASERLAAAGIPAHPTLQLLHTLIQEHRRQQKTLDQFVQLAALVLAPTSRIRT